MALDTTTYDAALSGAINIKYVIKYVRAKSERDKDHAISADVRVVPPSQGWYDWYEKRQNWSE
jgi:hypothetical protein